MYMLQKNGRYTELTLFIDGKDCPLVNKSAGLEILIYDLSANANFNKN